MGTLRFHPEYAEGVRRNLQNAGTTIGLAKQELENCEEIEAFLSVDAIEIRFELKKADIEKFCSDVLGNAITVTTNVISAIDEEYEKLNTAENAVGVLTEQLNSISTLGPTYKDMSAQGYLWEAEHPVAEPEDKQKTVKDLSAEGYLWEAEHPVAKPEDKQKTVKDLSAEGYLWEAEHPVTDPNNIKKKPENIDIDKGDDYDYSFKLNSQSGQANLYPSYELNNTVESEQNSEGANVIAENNTKNKVKVNLDELRRKFIENLKDYNIEDEINVAFNAIVVHEENDYNSNVDDIKYVDENGVTHFRYDATEKDVVYVANEKIGSLYTEDMTEEQKENAKGLNDTINEYLTDKIIGDDKSEKSDSSRAIQKIEQALEEKGYKNVLEETYYTDKKATLKEALNKEAGDEKAYDELMSSVKIINGGKNDYSDEEIQRANDSINRIIDSISEDESKE